MEVPLSGFHDVEFPNTEHPPSLDGMFQSIQVSNALLGETLFIEHGRELLRLAVVLVGIPELAAVVVRHAISQAVLARHKYWGEVSSRVWLITLVLRECRHTPQRTGIHLPGPRFPGLDKLLSTTTLDSHLWALIDKLGKKYALLSVLYYGHSLTIDEIAYVQKRATRLIRIDLNRIDKTLQQHRGNCSKCSFKTNKALNLEQNVRDFLQASAPTLEGVMGEIPALQDEIQQLVNRGQKVERNAAFFWKIALAETILLVGFLVYWLGFRLAPELPFLPATVGPETPPPPQFYYYTVKPGDTLEGIAEKAGVSINVILFANQFPKGYSISPGQLLVVPVSPSQDWFKTPVPITPLPPPEPLTLNMDIQTIQQRAIDNLKYWHSMWADVLIINYGLPGYVGPPQSINHKQVWMIQPSHFRIIEGPAPGKPYDSYVIINGHIYVKNFQNGQIFEDITNDTIFDLDLQKLLIPYEIFNRYASMELIGEGIVADRPTIVVDWHNVSGGRVLRLWIDAQYGVILRRREFGGADFSTVLVDITVNAINYDINFPATIFNPTSFPGDHYVQDYTGTPLSASAPIVLPNLPPLSGHEPLPRLSPPPGFDPSHSRLTFQWASTSNDGSGSNPSLDLFAGNYYLGQLPIGQAEILTCKRSPDGRLIAYSWTTSQPGNRNISLDLVDLTSIGTWHPLIVGGSLTGDFAFSPDSRSIAFFNCQVKTNDCIVFIQDLQTNARMPLISLSFADYFLWKPDGQYLALLGAKGGSLDWKFMIVDVNTGEVTYQGQFDWNRLSATSDSPSNSWGVPFQIQSGGLEGCIKPP